VKRCGIPSNLALLCRRNYWKVTSHSLKYRVYTCKRKFFEAMGSVLAEGCIFALGNPLLDISGEVTPEFLSKYNLKPNDAILAEEKHEPLYQEMIETCNVQYIPGGATLNSIRYAQWLLNNRQPRACTYVGCVGEDEYAKTLTNLCTKDSVNVQFYRTKVAHTGTCAVCVTGHDRSLVANLGAANMYDKSAHLESAEIWSLVEKAKVFYCAGFPLTVTPDGVLALAKHATENNKIFATNLSAPFICQFFKEPLMNLIPYTDYLFSNEAEAVEFATHNGGPASGDVREIAKWASKLPMASKTRSRFVVFTQGLDPTVVAKDGEIILEVPVEKVPVEKVVDTNSAGDSFVGGFLAALVQGLSLEQEVKLGQAAAKYCVQKPGSVVDAADAELVLKEAGL
jgi:adenosine kinase